MLEVQGLSVSYGQHRALENASLKIGRGEIVVILGANGAGKSTLLKAISGICEGRASGTITMQGKDILGLTPNRIVDEGIALVPEGRGVFGDLTVAENLRLGAHAPRARDEESGNLERVLRLFPKLHERRRQVVRTMSGGEQQMVAIGRAMMSNPVLLTLDEPSLGLSPLLCKELFQALKTVRDTGIGILLVEQNARQSLAIADRGYLLENSRIIHEGKAEDLRKDPAVQAAYLGGGGRTGASSHRSAAQPAISAPVPASSYTPPRITGSSPDDIAAAALAGLSAAAPVRQEAAPPSASVTLGPPIPASRETGYPEVARNFRQVDEAPIRPAPSSPPAPAMRGKADALLNGLSIGELVSEASQSSRERYGNTLPAAPPRSLVFTAPTMPNIPSTGPGNSQDRLQSILKEIEEAAIRARTAPRDPRRS
ncbi:ABC transporter ATP-binding protein (plasmid) [Neorhizobium sp. SOG26]|uniref:ABC transporter ATP-binding protein n=1 Tax=Neorhizobium sp. SOG26 TaxID=2060726 RepID=UPI000E57B9C5|nr:ABC transporter ATP-binding protein [Neorhizobium sp. SOG26]AXV17659.1 ABC transporter ATP-binding protein [Neorhizobium sp. SOG26]